MTPARFHEITARYPQLKLAVVGDYCLDRYYEIDPELTEISIETGLPVHNVVRIRAQAGGAGTVLNNLSALGVGTLRPVGFCGDDGEGYELRRALAQLPGVLPHAFFSTPERRTFTYGKPLVVERGQPPRELNRLDSKNWTLTPAALDAEVAKWVRSLGPEMDGVMVMEQVDVAGTGVVGPAVRAALDELAAARPGIPLMADSRLGVRAFGTLSGKMNLAELGVLVGRPGLPATEAAPYLAELARERQRPVFVTMAELGMMGALPDGTGEQVPAFPVAGEIDVVGAGDSVTANLTAALAAGATLREAMTLAMAAANTVVHQLGTTGVATVGDLARKLGFA